MQGGAPEPRFLAVGRVIGAHGIRGEIKVEILSDDPQRFDRIRDLYLGPDDIAPLRRNLEGFRLHGGRALLKLEGSNDRSTAESLRGLLVLIPIEEALPLEKDEYYEHQVIGLEMWTTGGEHLGQVVEILYTGANEVYVVRAPASPREILIPAIADVVQEVDLEAGRIVVELMEGLV